MKAVRLYESLGLLGTVARRGSYRVYSVKHVRQVRLIKQAQSMGFRLADLAPVLGQRRSSPDWPQLITHIEYKRTSLQHEIERLRGLDQQLCDISAEIVSCLDADSAEMAAVAQCDTRLDGGPSA